MSITQIDQSELLHFRKISYDTILSLDQPTLTENSFDFCAGGQYAQGSYRRQMKHMIYLCVAMD